MVSRIASLLALALAGTATSQAAVIYSAPGTTAELASPASFSTPMFDAASGSGVAFFTIIGYNSLDGANNGQFTDNFTLSLNGNAILTGAYALGGHGVNQTLSAPAGTTAAFTYNGYYQGGTATFAVPLALQSGANSLTFAYATTSPQGLADEGWAISNLSVSGSAVPEAASWAMFMVGFGAIGGVIRRRPAVSFA